MVGECICKKLDRFGLFIRNEADDEEDARGADEAGGIFQSVTERRPR